MCGATGPTVSPNSREETGRPRRKNQDQCADQCGQRFALQKKTATREILPSRLKAIQDVPMLCRHSHCDRTIVDRSDIATSQPKSFFALVASATSLGGSPARRPSILVGIGLPVTFRAVSITSITEYPFPAPR